MYVCAFVLQIDKYAIQLGIATQWNEVSIQARHTIPSANQLNGMEQSVLFHFAIKTHVAHFVHTERKKGRKEEEKTVWHTTFLWMRTKEKWENFRETRNSHLKFSHFMCLFAALSFSVFVFTFSFLFLSSSISSHECVCVCAWQKRNYSNNWNYFGGTAHRSHIFIIAVMKCRDIKYSEHYLCVGCLCVAPKIMMSK